MAKTKTEQPAAGEFDPQVQDEASVGAKTTATVSEAGVGGTDAVAADAAKHLSRLEEGLQFAMKEIASLQNKLKALQDAGNNAGTVLQQSDPRKEILDRAAVIAGHIAAGSVTEGLLSGSHATTISLSSIRIAATLPVVFEKCEAFPELLTQHPISKAHDALEVMLRCGT